MWPGQLLVQVFADRQVSLAFMSVCLIEQSIILVRAILATFLFRICDQGTANITAIRQVLLRPDYDCI